MKLVSKGDRHLLWRSGSTALFMYRGMTETLAFLMTHGLPDEVHREHVTTILERTNILELSREEREKLGNMFIIGFSPLPVSTKEQWEIHEQHFPIDITMNLLPEPTDYVFAY